MKNYAEIIVDWYNQNKRNLPWRKDNSPYHVWISKVMLQQTRIEAVINYYHRFMKEIPDIPSLAIVEEERLLKLWEGLGYYSRAKNLKKASQQIIQEYQGEFPREYTNILTLPGIGEYTASAIASICFNDKQVALDGNILRVYTRFYNDTRNIDERKTKKAIHDELQIILPKDRSSFNQGLMEIGEVICLPTGTPKCELCPLQKDCLARKKQTYLTLPIKNPKKEKTIEHYTILLYYYQNQVAIYKREKESLLNNLWSFPTIDSHLTKTKLKKYLENEKICYHTIEKGPTYTHIFTHKKWNMKSYFIEISKKETLKNYHWVKKSELESLYAIPTAFRPFKQSLIERENENETHIMERSRF